MMQHTIDTIRNLIEITYEFKRMFSLLLRIVQQLFAKVLKSGHRLALAGRALNKVASESCKVPLIREISIKGALRERSVRWGLCLSGWRYSGQAALTRARCLSLRKFNCVFSSVGSQPSSRTSLSEQKRFKTKPATTLWMRCTLFCRNAVGG